MLRIVIGDNPVQVKFGCKEVDPRENSRAVHISPYNSGTVIDSEESSIKANRKSTAGFPTSRHPRSCVSSALTSPEWGSEPKLVVFRRNFDQKQLKVCYKVLLSENFQRQGCSAINYPSNGINTLAGMTPFPYNLARKTSTSNTKDARFTFHTGSAVQSALADLVLKAQQTERAVTCR